eukprot:g335.t1
MFHCVLPPPLVAVLSGAGISCAEDLLARDTARIVQEQGLTTEIVDLAKRMVIEHGSAPVRTAQMMLEEEGLVDDRGNLLLSAAAAAAAAAVGQGGTAAASYVALQPCATGVENIDTLLGGGFWPGEITELAGGSATGKTQLCHLAALYASRRRPWLSTSSSSSSSLLGGGGGGGGGGEGAPDTVIYLDTSSSFSPLRLEEMYTERFVLPAMAQHRHQHQNKNHPAPWSSSSSSSSSSAPAWAGVAPAAAYHRALSRIHCVRAFDVHEALAVVEEIAARLEAGPCAVYGVGVGGGSGGRGGGRDDLRGTAAASGATTAAAASAMGGGGGGGGGPRLGDNCDCCSLALLVVDSATALLQPVLATGAAGRGIMMSFAAALRRIADYGVAVVTTNSTVADVGRSGYRSGGGGGGGGGTGGGGGGGGLDQTARAALGASWRVVPGTRVLLERDFPHGVPDVATSRSSSSGGGGGGSSSGGQLQDVLVATVVKSHRAMTPQFMTIDWPQGLSMPVAPTMVVGADDEAARGH